MQLIDTHCHLYLPEFDNDRLEVMKRAKQGGVKKFYLPAIDSKVLDRLLQMEETFRDECFAMIGLHPCSVNNSYEEELDSVEGWLKKRKFVAVGEIGLDFYWDTTFAKQQLQVFEQQMQWALQYNLPVVIHTRQAMQQTIEAVKPYAAKGLKGIFHCFGDDVEVARQITEMGFLLGIGGVLTYKNARLDVVIEQVALENLVLETDAPYLAPVPFRGKRNESSYILNIAEKLAQIKGISVEEVARITSANAEKLFMQ